MVCSPQLGGGLGIELGRGWSLATSTQCVNRVALCLTRCILAALGRLGLRASDDNLARVIAGRTSSSRTEVARGRKVLDSRHIHGSAARFVPLKPEMGVVGPLIGGWRPRT